MEDIISKEVSFKIQYQETYKALELSVSEILQSENNRKLSYNIGLAINMIKHEFEKFTLKRADDGSLKPDYYSESLFKEFNINQKQYEDPKVAYFFSDQFSAIKARYKDTEHVYPEHYHLNEDETVKLLAQRLATEQMLNTLQALRDKDDIDSVLDRIKAGIETLGPNTGFTSSNIEVNSGNTGKLSMRQQTLILNYLLNTLSGNFYNKVARARFIEKITEKSFDNIKKVVQNPLDSKDAAYLIKDLLVVKNEFEKLELTNLAEKIDIDIESLD